MNESSLRTALSRMTTHDARGWRWLHERQQYVQKERKTIMQLECGARETQRFSTHRMQTYPYDSTTNGQSRVSLAHKGVDTLPEPYRTGDCFLYPWICKNFAGVLGE